MTKDEALKFYDQYVLDHPELTQAQLDHIENIKEAIRNKYEAADEPSSRLVKCEFTETYTYTLMVRVYDGETAEDAVHEVDLLIDRDKQWLDRKRDEIRVENYYNIEEEV